MAHHADDDDVMLRGLAQVVESQSERIEALRRTVVVLQGQLQAKVDMGVLTGIEARPSIDAVRAAIADGDVTGANAELDRLTSLIEQLGQPAVEVDPSLPRAPLRTVRLGDLVEQAVISVVARHGTNRITTSLDDDLRVATSPARLLAILVAMLESAVRRGHGPVELVCRFSPDRHLAIEVADRGTAVGTVDSDLGLVRVLARSLGGDVAVADRVGGGTIAGVWLPQRRDDDPAPAPAAAPQRDNTATC